jgi:hypothetical protein
MGVDDPVAAPVAFLEGKATPRESPQTTVYRNALGRGWNTHSCSQGVAPFEAKRAQLARTDRYLAYNCRVFMFDVPIRLYAGMLMLALRF